MKFVVKFRNSRCLWLKMDIKIPTLADTIVSKRVGYLVPGVLLRCPASACVDGAPWHLPTAATRSGRFICHRPRSPRSPASHLRFGSDRYKNKSHSECIIHYGIYWHILHNLIQCNANRQSVAFVKLSRVGRYSKYKGKRPVDT